MAARELFAERGFYGASLASIATELNVTKQTLLHHFESKERLYAIVLSSIAEDYLEAMETFRRVIPDPLQRLEALILGRASDSREEAISRRIVMRELLDNQQRVERVKNWYLRPWLDGLTDTVMEIPAASGLERSEALALVYMLLGAASFLAVSEPTLAGMYGRREYAELEAAYPQQLRALLQARLG